MFETCVISCGSANCIIVCSDQASILLDAGTTLEQTIGAFATLNIDRSSLRAIVVSHEHEDHIRGVGAISRALRLPVLITKKTHSVCSQDIGYLGDRLIYFEQNVPIVIDDIHIHPYASYHDAVGSSNFCFRHMKQLSRKLGVVTDLGKPLEQTVEMLTNCTTIVLESFYDDDLLNGSEVDLEFKTLLRNNQIHLSNKQAVDLVKRIIHPELKNIILAHISLDLNRPDLATQAMKSYLDSIQSRISLSFADTYSVPHFIDV